MISELLKTLNYLLEELKKSESNVSSESYAVIKQQNEVINVLINRINDLTIENNKLKQFERENYNNNEVKQ